jgi:hypothetical protein
MIGRKAGRNALLEWRVATVKHPRLGAESSGQKRLTIGKTLFEENMADNERRRTQRYGFIASAELVEIKADVRMVSRVSELSRHGCYLDMINPFPKDTLVLVKISAGDAYFEGKGNIAYTQPNLGAGVKFTEIEQQYVPVLERWLDELEQERVRKMG